MNEDAEPRCSRPWRNRLPERQSCCVRTPRSPLLPTIRSRCARMLGPVGVREIEAILAEVGAADAGRGAGRADRRWTAGHRWRGSPDPTPSASAMSSAARCSTWRCLTRRSTRRDRALAAQAAEIVGIGEGRVPCRPVSRRLARPQARVVGVVAAARRIERRGPLYERRPAEDGSADDASTGDAAADGADDTGQIACPSGRAPTLPKRSSRSGRTSPATSRCASAVSTARSATSPCSTTPRPWRCASMRTRSGGSSNDRVVRAC